jgi:predicted small lipoprotein YifL
MLESSDTILIFAIGKKMLNKIAISSLIVWGFLAAACGIKGPPLPPIETIEAETSINAKAVQTTSASATTQVVPASTDKTKSKK